MRTDFQLNQMNFWLVLNLQPKHGRHKINVYRYWLRLKESKLMKFLKNPDTEVLRKVTPCRKVTPVYGTIDIYYKEFTKRVLYFFGHFTLPYMLSFMLLLQD